MKSHRLIVTVFAGALAIALAPAAAAAQRRAAPAHRGGGHPAAVRPVYAPSYGYASYQVNALVSLTTWLRLDAGLGYRLIGGADLLHDDLRGVSGSIALQFGGR